jgi:hypothetical protein
MEFLKTGFPRLALAVLVSAIPGLGALEIAPTPAPQPQIATSPVAPVKLSNSPPQVTYVDGQLAIHAQNTMLSDILEKVSAVTGVHFEIPENAHTTPITIVQLGPGPARQILASLLSDSHCDYVLEASDTDPDQLQSVQVIVKASKDIKAATNDLPVPTHSPYAPSVIQKNVAQNAEKDSASPEPMKTAEASDAEPASQSADLPQPAEAPSSHNVKSSLMPTPVTSPAPAINPQSPGQQLQQMYQQRMQMIQQARQITQQ